MSSFGQYGSGGPFGDLMRDLARLFNSPGPVNWEVAGQFAQWAASGGQPEANVDPLARVRLEELLRVAELHIGEESGLPGGSVLSLRCATPSEWARLTLEAWKPLLERLASAASRSMTPPPGEGPAGIAPGDLGGLLGSFGGLLGPGAAPPAGGDDPGATGADPMAAMFGNLPRLLGPLLFGMQSGAMVGELARRSLGQYDLPMPRPAGPQLLVVPSGIDGFATEWSLPPDDVRLWVCLREVAHHTVLGRPHVRERVERLVGDYVDAFEPDAGFLEERLSGLDPSDLGSLQSALGDPASLLAEMRNDTQRRLQVPLNSLLSVVTGWVDHVMERAGRRLIDTYGPLTEALHRRRLEDHSGVRAAAQMFGVELDAASVERGQRFVAGVVERAGEDALGRLWRSPADLPTPPEVDAPGLWLARIDLELPGG